MFIVWINQSVTFSFGQGSGSATFVLPLLQTSCLGYQLASMTTRIALFQLNVLEVNN